MIAITLFNGDVEKWASFALFQQTVKTMSHERAALYNGATYEYKGKVYEISVEHCPMAHNKIIHQ